MATTAVCLMFSFGREGEGESPPAPDKREAKPEAPIFLRTNK